jgi:muramoyltetrapeptide carboxypeptidase
MIIPKYLSEGDSIGFVAPARSVHEMEVETAVKSFEKKGLKVILGRNLFNKQFQFSGSDIERSNDMQDFLDNPEIKAIICVRGGYGSIRTIQNLNFDKFVKNPKWIVGYSDITVFHSYINSVLKIETLHAPMPFNFGKENFDVFSIEKIFEILFGNTIEYTFNSNLLNCQGKAKGKLVGGNLSVLYSLRGTKFDIHTQNKILFIEDIDEYLYHIDRMMMNLKLGGKLDGLRGVIIGEMTDMKDNSIPFGKNVNEIILEFLKDANIPVCFGFPAGHGIQNFPLILGREVVLNLGNTCKLSFS